MSGHNLSIPSTPLSGPWRPRRPGVKQIDPSKHKEVRAKLHQYRMAVQLQGVAVPTSLESSSPFQRAKSSQGSLSSASRTLPHAMSEASFATSCTEYTVIWSQKDGSTLADQTKKPLCPAMKAQKALMRYLGQCLGDCRKRKVKCSLLHHSIEDILTGPHDDQVIEDVEWALNYDSEAKGLDSLSRSHEIEENETAEEQKPSMLQRAVIDNAANKLDMPTTPDNIYPSTINEVDFEDSAPGLEEFTPPISNSFQHYNPMLVPRQEFVTDKTSRTLPLAVEIVNPSFSYYQCRLCSGNPLPNFVSLQDLIAHTQHQHKGFVPLPDPMRWACPNCFEFYPNRSGHRFCSNSKCISLRHVLQVNICGEFYLKNEVHWASEDTRLIPYGTYN